MSDMRFLCPHTAHDGRNPERSAAEKVERPESADSFFVTGYLIYIFLNWMKLLDEKFELIVPAMFFSCRRSDIVHRHACAGNGYRIYSIFHA
jgi:hypothetical protein